MATLASLSPHLIIRRFILNRPTHAAAVSLAKKPFLPLRPTPYFTSTRFFCLSPASSQQFANDVALLKSVETESEGESNAAESAHDVAIFESVETESEGESNAAGASAAVSEGLKISNLGAVKTPPPPPPPSLSVKEKKELASFAHSLGKKLKSQQVGKSGVTDTVVTALIETLEANELLKLKIHNSCPGELKDAVKQLEESTGSVAVGQIGRTVILYRPSLALQLKAEEKKKRAQALHLKRRPVFQQSAQRKSAASEPVQEPRQYARGRQGGRRGSSRF